MNKTQNQNLSIWQILFSILASFIGIQKHKNMQRDMAYLEEHGFILFIIAGGLKFGQRPKLDTAHLKAPERCM